MLLSNIFEHVIDKVGIFLINKSLNISETKDRSNFTLIKKYMYICICFMHGNSVSVKSDESFN